MGKCSLVHKVYRHQQSQATCSFSKQWPATVLQLLCCVSAGQHRERLYDVRHLMMNTVSLVCITLWLSNLSPAAGRQTAAQLQLDRQHLNAQQQIWGSDETLEPTGAALCPPVDATVLCSLTYCTPAVCGPASCDAELTCRAVLP